MSPDLKFSLLAPPTIGTNASATRDMMLYLVLYLLLILLVINHPLQRVMLVDWGSTFVYLSNSLIVKLVFLLLLFIAMFGHILSQVFRGFNIILFY